MLRSCLWPCRCESQPSFTCLNEPERIHFFTFPYRQQGVLYRFLTRLSNFKQKSEIIFLFQKMENDEKRLFLVQDRQKTLSYFVLCVYWDKNGDFRENSVFWLFCTSKKSPKPRFLEISERKHKYFFFFRLIRFTPVN